MPSPIPPHALRLFPGQEGGFEEGGAASPWVIGRLFEDGDSRDLAWLAATISEERLAGWLERHGRRQLSRRSRAFWEVVLGRPAGPPPEDGADIRSDLWPL